MEHWNEMGELLSLERDVYLIISLFFYFCYFFPSRALADLKASFMNYSIISFPVNRSNCGIIHSMILIFICTFFVTLTLVNLVTPVKEGQGIKHISGAFSVFIFEFELAFAGRVL